MRPLVVAALAGLLAAAPVALANPPLPPEVALVGPHLRPDGFELRSLVADAADRSPTFRQLLDRLERSDLIVYVRVQHFPSAHLEGRIGFVTGAGPRSGRRILLIELACPRTLTQQAATLAHELHHASEIADAPWVTGPGPLADYYRRIGEPAAAPGHGAAFETRAARDTAARVQREIAGGVKWSHDTP